MNQEIPDAGTIPLNHIDFLSIHALKGELQSEITGASAGAPFRRSRTRLYYDQAEIQSANVPVS